MPDSTSPTVSVWPLIGALLAGSAVAFGAFGAHSLQGRLYETLGNKTRTIHGVEVLSAERFLANFQTGAEYQMTHGLAILAVSALAAGGGMRRSRWLHVACGCWLCGIIVFSGSLYLLAYLMAPKWGAVTPIGGVFLILGWLAAIVGCWPTAAKAASPDAG